VSVKHEKRLGYIMGEDGEYEVSLWRKKEDEREGIENNGVFPKRKTGPIFINTGSRL
jgi:hypothetical protein